MSEDHIYYVYLHRRDDTNEVFYVGKGCKNRANMKKGRSEWWNRIVAKAGGFSVEYVEKGLSEDDAFDLEIELIKFYRECNHPICNISSGGTGSACSEEGRKKISESLKGNKRTLGFKHSDETKAKLSVINTGKKMSEESKAKMSASQKTRGPMTEETRAKMSIANSGRKQSASVIEARVAPRRLPVLCSNGMLFESSGSAVKWLKSTGFPKAVGSNIASCCRGTFLKSAYGYTWKYVELTNLKGNTMEQIIIDGVNLSELKVEYDALAAKQAAMKSSIRKGSAKFIADNVELAYKSVELMKEAETLEEAEQHAQVAYDLLKTVSFVSDVSGVTFDVPYYDRQREYSDGEPLTSILEDGEYDVLATDEACSSDILTKLYSLAEGMESQLNDWNFSSC